MRVLRLGIVVAILALLAVCRAEAAETGFALAGAVDGADVYLDGDKIGTTPLSGTIPCAVGEHTIRVARPGYAPYIDVFQVRQGKVTRIEIDMVPVSGVLRVGANVERARVFVDGQFVGETPLEVEMKLGARTVRVSRSGYRDEVFTVHSVAGQLVERQVRLAELPPGLNPYRVVEPPPRWYERWWVWTVGAAGVAALSVAILVPAVYFTRSPCDRLGADVCLQVPATSPGPSLRLQGTF
ncbi:MAG: PEGA domain-containing protein [Myxococcales bacterium]|nr:PEGA domain-containing protein [Myxococcota bacterium]MDW8280965.1 PEGA domain-containing protein [Myxococcales bacterium]